MRKMPEAPFALAATQCVGCYREQRPAQRKAYRARQRERAVRQAVPIRSFDF